jgi:hypothetical protein
MQRCLSIGNVALDVLNHGTRHYLRDGKLSDL